MSVQKRPMYIQIQNILRRKIRDKTYLPGVAIPSDAKIASQFGVSRITVHNAIESLIDEGILKRIGKQGVYVLYNRKNTFNTLNAHLEIMPSANDDDDFIEKISDGKKTIKVANIDEKYINGYISKAEKFEAEKFQIALGDELFNSKKVFSREGVPYCLEISVVPKKYIPNIDKVNFRAYNLVEMFDAYDIKINRLDQRADIVTLNKNDAKRINAKGGEAVLYIESNVFDEKNRLIEHRISYANPHSSYVFCKF